MYFAPSLALLVAGAALAAAEGCHGDNLLRAMERHNGTAYCSSLLRSSGTGTGTVLSPHLPSDVPSTYAPSLVSSAVMAVFLSPGSQLDVPGTVSLRFGDGDGDGDFDHLFLERWRRWWGHGFDGGYTYSFPAAGSSASTGPTCGRDWATTTVQVTETMVSTVYVYSSGASRSSSSSDSSGTDASSTLSFSFPSDGDSGGRPPPPPTTTTTGSTGTASAWVSTFTVGNSTFVSTVPGGSSVSLVVRPPGPTTWTVNGTTVTVPGASIPTTSGTASSSTTTPADGASSWTLSWISTVPANESTATSPPPWTSSSAPLPDPSAASTVTSEVGGAGSTRIVTVGVTSGPVPFPNSTSTSTLRSSGAASAAVSVVTSVVSGAVVTRTVIGGSTVTGTADSVTLVTSAEAAPSRPASGGVTVITSIVGGGAESTWTLIDGSAVGPSSSGTTSARVSPTASGTFSVITSVVGGVASTWTVIGGSTFTGSSSSAPTTTPSPTDSVPVSASLITSFVDGVVSTWTLIGGSTVSGVLGEPTSTPAQSTAVSAITSVFGGVASTWTLVGGSTITGSSSPSDAATPTLPPGASIVTSIIDGIASSWTVIGGSTVFASTSSALATPTLPPGASVVTSIVGGIASSWTVIGGSTIYESTSSALATPTLPPGASIVTSIVGGIASSWTVIGGSTIFDSTTSALATPTLPPGASIVTSIVDGTVSSWTVIGGSTIFDSTSSTLATPTLPPGATVITSVIGGVASSWTVIGGSTIFGSASPTDTAGATVITSVVGGVASTWTVIGGSTIFGTLTQPLTSTGNVTSVAASSSSPSYLSSSSSSATKTSSSATPTSGYDSAFTGISVVVARNGSTCYVLPTPTASLHESLLNVTAREPPSIDAFYLDPATNSVKYLRLRDGNANPILVDVSDPSKLAIVDGAGNVLSIDREGLHFTSANCSPKIDVFISGFFEQLAALSGQSCGGGDEVQIPVNGTGRPSSSSSSVPLFGREGLDARQEQSFDVVLHLRDQCGDLVRPDLPVSVSLGDTECLVLPGAAGDFVASCAFPGGESNSMECETSVQQTLDHLTQGSLAGTCPSFASVWSLLSRDLDRVVNFDGLLQPFLDAGLDLGSDAGRGIRSVIDTFMRLYDFSTSTFQNSSTSDAGASSRLEDVIEEYGVAAIRTDVCRSLVSSETLTLTFTAGVSAAPVPLADISSVPSPRPEYERSVTDPTALACCPNASRCVVRDGQEFYPPEASIEGSDCLCGTTLEGRGVGFRTGRCVGYDQCNATSPCAGAGAVCLVDSCCGFSVCVNGTECSAPAVGRRWVSLFGSETSGGMF
ncbi:hypothetical protein CTA1_2447 [Colletotrichum tanaceti]|uniref:Uncharacterized protein n=1 Tax=Colletotrichum tanaceti TaxID=1306861 RepID=A0A4U6X7T2_9PEZI|nr:hypothetical protein CTA1_2447 [Colletotrichum tanaceti]